MGRGRAELEGCARCIQILVLLFNLIFFIFGLAMLGYGIYALIYLGEYVSFSSVDILSGSKLLIGAGVLISVISFFGCCGAWKLHKCLLICFMIALFIILCCEIAAAVIGFMHQNELKDNLNTDMKDVFNKYGQKGQNGTSEVIDLLQKKEKCCGINEPKDWQTTRWGKHKQYDLPDSCCEEFKTNCGKGAITRAGNVKPGYFEKGCAGKVVQLVEKYFPVIGGIAIGIVVVQLLGMIFAGVLIHGVNKGTYA